MRTKYVDILKELKSRLQNSLRDKFKSLYLFGSVAKGTDDEDSDIDILVLCDFGGHAGKKEQNQIYDITCDIELEKFVVFHDIVEDVLNIGKYEIISIIQNGVKI
jgi:predicted nucleotidyltransferase